MAEEDVDQDDSVEESGGSKKKLIIMIAGGVVLLAIIAGAGLYFTGFFDEEVPVEQTVDGEEGSAEKETEDSSDDADADSDSSSATVYEALNPPFMVNFPDGNIKVIKVAVSLMATDSAVIDAVKLHDPVIRNNILFLLSGQDPETLKTAEGKQSLQTAVKVEINKVLMSRKVKSTVKEVFFTDLVMQ
jgi:flagellar FliL protein